MRSLADRWNAAAAAVAAAARRALYGRPFAYVIDDDSAICDAAMAALATLGVESMAFHTAKEALASLERRPPTVIFLDVALLQSDAIDVVNGLGRSHYRGVVHLMSGGNRSLVQAVERIGVRQGVTFGAPLPKPIKREAICEAIERLGRGASR